MPARSPKVVKSRTISSVKSKSKTKVTTTASRKVPAKSLKTTKTSATSVKSKETSAAKGKKLPSKTKPLAPKKKTVAKGLTKKDTPSKKTQPKVVTGTAKNIKPTSKILKPKTGGKKTLELPEKLRDAALKVLDERKAEDILCIDLRGRSSLADYAMIASGTSARQLGAIANYLLEAFAKLGVKGVRVEGLPQGDWVLVDAGDILIHMFRPEVRTYYQIEDIWSETTR